MIATHQRLLLPAVIEFFLQEDFVAIKIQSESVYVLRGRDSAPGYEYGVM